MPTVNDKLKLAYVFRHEDDGLMLTVKTKAGQTFDMALSPSAAAMLLGQLTQGVKESLQTLERLP